jgi:acyl-CoA synthetase (AMP-forming)/AMP-acid ligase II
LGGRVRCSASCQEWPLLLHRILLDHAVVQHGGRDIVTRSMEGPLHRTKRWPPDDVVPVDELPHAAAGKLPKSALREQYQDHLLQREGAA